MNTYKNQSFFKIAFRFTIGFLVIVLVLEVLFSLVKNGSFNGMASQYFYNGNWKYFLFRGFVMSLFYGLFMAGYYKFIKK